MKNDKLKNGDRYVYRGGHFVTLQGYHGFEVGWLYPDGPGYHPNKFRIKVSVINSKLMRELYD